MGDDPHGRVAWQSTLGGENSFAGLAVQRSRGRLRRVNGVRKQSPGRCESSRPPRGNLNPNHGSELGHPLNPICCGARRAELDASPRVLPRTQSCPEHLRDRGYTWTARGAVGTGLVCMLIRPLVALPDSGGADGGLSSAAVHDPARLRSRRFLSPSAGERLGRSCDQRTDVDAL